MTEKATMPVIQASRTKEKKSKKREAMNAALHLRRIIGLVAYISQKVLHSS